MHPAPARFFLIKGVATMMKETLRTTRKEAPTPLPPPKELAPLSAYLHESIAVTDEALTDDTLGKKGGGYGNPITLHFYYDAARQYHGSAIGHTGDVTVLYVMNTRTPRFGKDTDAHIVSSLLKRGFYVVVLDFSEDPVTSPDLDWSIQEVRSRLIDGRIVTPNRTLDARADVALNYVLPAGYNMTYGIPYFAYDLHGAPGCLEETVRVWNNDCRSVKRDFIVCWVDGEGRHKPTAPLDETDPYHYGQSGDFPDGEHGKCYGVWFQTADGSDRGITNRELEALIKEDPKKAASYRYTYMGNTYARDIYDCVKPDGSFLDLVLRMDVLYPTGAENTPVMIAFSSSYTRVAAWTSERRPQLTGFLLSGYSGVISDYGCVPMCRSDHYWYLSGTEQKYSVSGNNYTYSLAFYDSISSDTALLRTLRALGSVGIDYSALTDPRDLVTDGSRHLRYSFDLNAIGGYGNSKSGTIVRLGTAHPERLFDIRRPEGQIGFSRYDLLCDPSLATDQRDNGGKVVSRYCDPYVGDGVTDKSGAKLVRDPVEQPFKRGNRYEYSSSLNLVYAQCGACAEAITEGHAPIFATGTQQGMGGGGSYYFFYNELINRARAANVPFFGLVSPRLGHTYGYGEDMDYGIDTYAEFHKYANYYLQNASPSCEIIDVDTGDDLPIASEEPLTGTFRIGKTRRIGLGFIGQIPGGDNLNGIRIVNAETGKELHGAWQSAFGGQQWSFTPFDIEEGENYRITVTTDVKDRNGRPLARERSLLFTASGKRSVLSDLTTPDVPVTEKNAVDARFSRPEEGERVFLRFAVTRPASNTLAIKGAVLSACGAVCEGTRFASIGTVRVNEVGIYTLDVTEFIRAAKGYPVAFRFLAQDGAGEWETGAFRPTRLSAPISSLANRCAAEGARLGYTAVADLASPEEGAESMLRIFGQTRVSSWIDLSRRLCNNYTLINGIPLLSFTKLLSERPLEKKDVGRTYRVTLSLYDTTSRLLSLSLHGSTMTERDYHLPLRTLHTKRGYNRLTLDLTLTGSASLTALNREQLLLFAENKTPVTLPEDAAVHADGYARREAKKTAAQVGRTGLAEGYHYYEDAEAAYAEGIVTVNEAHALPLYIGDVTCTEITSDVSLCGISLSYEI